MTVYAPVPAFADRKRHPRALILIVGAPAALLAAVMTVKMDLPGRFDPTKTEVKLIPLPPEPAPNPPAADPRQKQVVTRTPQIVPLPQPDLPAVDRAPLPLPLPDPGPRVGPSVEPAPIPPRTGPRFATPASKLRPPYPLEKRRLEEEAVLRLKLAIDERG